MSENLTKPDDVHPDSSQIQQSVLPNAQVGGNISIGDITQIGTQTVYQGSAPQEPLEIPWHEVSAQLLEERRQLTSNLMTRRGDVAHEVDQVFVPLGLVERKKVPRQSGEVSPERGSQLYQEGRGKGRRSLKDAVSIPLKNQELRREADSDLEEITQKFEHQQFLEQVLDQGQSPKSQGKRIAIIGEPGAGKTTLLQQIGCWVVDTFPESMVIWVSLADLQGDTLETYLEHRWLRRVIRQAGGAEASQADIGNFANQFNQGRVWLLLDGLDEMQAAGNPLSEIQRQIREGGWLQQARILLTCRVNQWDGNRNALDSFDVYRTLEFSYPQQVEQFVAQWFSPQDKTDLGEALCAALKESGKERIQDLVKNPLRLVLLCFDWGLKEGRLPETQAELYQRFVERIYEWKAEEFPTTEDQRQALNRALAQLSLAAIDDQDERGNARFRVRHRFVQRFLKGKLFDLALQLGWLNHVGVDADDPTQAVYAFYHTTFEEYFAALAIDDRDFFLPCTHRNKPVKDKPYRVFEPQWKQVMLLWLGCECGELDQRQDITHSKETFIQALMTFKDGCRGFYNDRAFLLAAAGIAEFRDYTRADAIVDRLMQWQLKGLWAELLDIRVAARRNLADSGIENTDVQRTIRALVQVLDSTQNGYTRRKVAENLGRVGTGNETAIRALVRVLDSTQEEDIRLTAADSLGQINPSNETAIWELVQVLDSTQNEDTRRKVAESLGRVGTSNETVIGALVRLLDSTPDQYTRRKAAESLGKVGKGNETVIGVLVRLLDSTPDQYTRLRAAESLGKVGKGNKIAIQKLLRLLDSTQNEYTRLRAAESLGQIDPGNEMAIRELVRLLDSTSDWYTRLAAAESLSKIGKGNKIAIKKMVRLLESTHNVETLWRAASSLGQIDPGNETAIRELVRLLDSTSDWYTRLRAAESLGQIDPGNETAIRELVQLLDSTQDEYTRLRVVESLGRIGAGNETAIQALVRLLDSTQTALIRLRAAESLGRIGTGNETAIRALVRLLDSTQTALIRLRASDSLCKIDPGNETAIRALVRLIRRPFLSQEVYQLMMKCAETLPYPEFYQAFHASR